MELFKRGGYIPSVNYANVLSNFNIQRKSYGIYIDTTTKFVISNFQVLAKGNLFWTFSPFF